MKRMWKKAAALAAVGAIVACNGSRADGTGGQYDSCLQSLLGTSCTSCLQDSCGGALGDFETSCGDFLDCVCPGGDFSASNAQSATCSSRLAESSCTSSVGENGAVACAACESACGSGFASSSGGSGTSSGGGSGGSSSGGGPDSCANPGNACILPPPAPSGGAPAAASHNYAIHTLYLGDTDRTGVSSVGAWRSYGYNLDGLVTTTASTDVCTLTTGASKTTQADGNGGIDNSFGENVLPIFITTAGADTSTKINTSIDDGTFTYTFDVTGFDDAVGNTATTTGLTGVFLAGGSYAAQNGGAAPAWSTTTRWPILPTLMNGCSATAGCGSGCVYGSAAGACPVNPVTAATTRFPSAYQVGGTFVTGASPSASIPLSLGALLPLDVRSAFVTFQPKAPGSVTNGTIAGVLVTTELVGALQSELGNISTSLCSGSAFQSLAEQIEQASDIVIDPSTGKVSNSAGTECNAISIGLGFDATEIAAPTSSSIEAAIAAAPNPCADAGE